MSDELINILDYSIQRELAEGGMAEVYLAEQIGINGFTKRVAIKIIKQELSKQQEFLDNFIGEAKLVADLVHTNIAQTYHLGESQGQYFIVMEYIRGINLQELSEQLYHKQMKLPIELAVFITSRVARALTYAHNKRGSFDQMLGIVHRDISFRNIMVSFEGDVKLMDFGIAKALGYLRNQEGKVLAGKPDYMSPEQAQFKITDARSDLFSTGVVLSSLILGYNIFYDEKPEKARKNVIRAKLPDFMKIDSRIDKRLDTILRKCLARDLMKRYQAAEELLHDLELYIYGSGYGPTNETLAEFIGRCFGQIPLPNVVISKGDTIPVSHATDWTPTLRKR
jgi:eukaryotic-like serine/threonine-protein kinase